jgi:hypothetical protein
MASAVVSIIDTILDSQRQRTLFGQHVALGRALFGAQWKDLRSDWDVLDTLTQWVVALYRDVGDGAIPEGLIQFLSGSPAVDRLRGAMASIRTESQRAADVVEHMRDMFAADVRWLAHYGFSAFAAPNSASGLS